MKTNERPVIVEQSFDAPIKMVWRAITEVVHMRKWFFDNIPEFEPEAGFKTEFNVKSGGNNFLHQWEITEVIPYKFLIYNWKYKGCPGDSYVLFELNEHESKVVLKLTHKVVEDFPDDVEEFKRESCKSGWEYFINNSLKEYLTVK
ncbi:MAG: SRPBCC domain-containing protein [Ignavibacteriae bacterium]|nr:SRPBCC domain-containing protein [Ignavibacteriota bacterium]NOG99587.1 SRPBCC domain-containing protein [Ignavibacteriota bacterium]